MKTIAPFQNAKEQFYQLRNTFDSHFPANVTEEIAAFIYKERDDKYDIVQQVIDERLIPIKELVKKNDPKLDRKMRTVLFIEKTNPNELAKDIQRIISLECLFDEYQRFIETLASRVHGRGVLKYQLNPELRQFIQSGIHSTASRVKEALEEYARAIKDFAHLLHQIKSSVGEKAFLRLGASVLGGMAGGLFGSVIAREITSSLLSDKDKIIQSTNQVFEKWEQYLEAFSDLIIEFEYSYLHIVATLFGGTLLQYDKEFRKANLHIDQLALGDYNFAIGFTSTELQKVRSWADNAILEIKGYMKERHTDKALEASNRFYQTVQSSSLLREVPYSEQYSLIYLANLHKYAVLTTKAEELRASNEIGFIAMLIEIYKQMPYLVHNEDLKQIGAFQQTDIILHWIRLCLKYGNIEALPVLLDYGLLMQKRGSNSEFYNGEQQSEHRNNDLEKILFLLGLFIKDSQKVEHPFIVRCAELKYVPRLSAIKDLRNRYTAQAGTDQFSKFMVKAARIKTLVNVIKPIFRRKFRAAVSVILLLVLVGYAGYSQQEKVQSWLATISKEIAKGEDPSVPLVSNEIHYLVVTTPQANVRVEPSLQAKPVSIVNQKDRLEYANEKREDEERRIWYKIALLDGRAGWISSKTVQWYE
ncbi:SH3 domain-containing protein [Paenibacillus silvisoli]|uniref:SH3 domain-containing protein n=1 Tax=Paenibacillus silvisoli TaxID=3110539 RepID=UPI002804784A|nr:SH3 domain-containing protein [Paenibacillus silvisoli]